jgi:hypothetical protein
MHETLASIFLVARGRQSTAGAAADEHRIFARGAGI